MNKPLICHFLIGPPGSGKSTFATKLSTLGNYSIISTDKIRSKLYGQETFQGEWSDIETNLLRQISQNITKGVPIIYDATNAIRPYRMSLLEKLPQENCEWIAWHLKTPLPTCLKWNKQRTRKVPETIVEKMFESLKNFQPLVAEGFAVVHTIQNATFEPTIIQQKIDSLNRSHINRRNRNSRVELHSYSRLLDFDRLMHLISLLIKYPGLGNLEDTEPDVLRDIFKEVREFPDALAEIVAVIALLKGEIYGNREAIANDLAWLEKNGIVAEGKTVDPAILSKEISPLLLTQERKEKKGTSRLALSKKGKKGIKPESKKNSDRDIIPHPYSDTGPFKRLMSAIRLILNKPFLKDGGKKSLDFFAQTLSKEAGIGGDCRDQFRKDVEYILKPFQILSDYPMRHGYFAGTGILSQNKLKRLQDLLQAQVKSMEDPIDLSTYKQFCERMIHSKIKTEEPYPIRAIAHQSMINLELLDEDVLSRQLDQVEEFIVNRKLVELERLKGKGKFTGDVEGKFAAWLLQIVFFNDAWYLGFECRGDVLNGLLRFERLDRLRISKDLGDSCSPEEQRSKLQRLQRLLDASFGIFLGYSAEDQRIFLRQEKPGKELKNQQKKQVIVTVELWFDEEKFKFVCEKTKRFPSGQLKMSPPPKEDSSFLQKKEYEKIFRLKGTKNRNFPYKFQVKLPCWCLKDVSFLSWVIGFGHHVKVKEPKQLKDTVYQTGLSIVEVYEQ